VKPTLLHIRALSREVPGAIPPPPDGQALSPVEVEYRRKHAPGLAKALYEYGDLTRYEGFHEGELRVHWPELWTAWTTAIRAENRLHLHMSNTMQRLGLTIPDSEVG
jgi:hypothetical protein